MEPLTDTLDSLLARRGELLEALEMVNRQIGEMHPATVQLCVVATCRKPISAERLRVSPTAVTCSPECRLVNNKRLRRENAQRKAERQRRDEVA